MKTIIVPLLALSLTACSFPSWQEMTPLQKTTTVITVLLAVDHLTQSDLEGRDYNHCEYHHDVDGTYTGKTCY